MDKKVKTDELTTPVKPFNIKTASSLALLQETNFLIRFCQCLGSAGVQIQTCFPPATILITLTIQLSSWVSP